MKPIKKEPRIKDIPWEKIQDQIQGWSATMSDNNERGKDMMEFVTQGEQWESFVTSERRLASKESLTFNICWKEMRKLRAQSKEVEFSLDVFPTTQEAEYDVEEKNAYSMLMDNIVLEKDIVNKVADTFDKSQDFGYAFGQVDFRRLSNDDLCYYPVYILHKDPRIGFWDVNALSGTKIDGRYCGLKRLYTEKELKKRIPKINISKCKIESSNNLVVDYWWRASTKANFVLLKSGRYVRKDRMTMTDKNNIMTRERLALLRKYGEIEKELEPEMEDFVDLIYFKRICNGVNIDPPVEYPTDDLPLPYHNGATYWTPENSNFCVPFGYHLKGAQKLYNYINSQIATQAKSCTSDKYFFSPSHVETPQQIENARNINKLEGGIAFGGDLATIRRERPAELSASLIQMAQTMKQMVDEIGGASIDANNAQMKILSGEALDRITGNMQIINDEALAKHVMFFNDVGELFSQMIPRIITEERVMVVKNKDGTGSSMIINEELGTGEIGNDISNLANKFRFNIKPSPTNAKSHQNANKQLMQAYQIDPTLFAKTAHVYFRNCNIKDSGELERLVMADMDPNLIKYSQGLMTQTEYDQAKQQQQQAQAQQQAEMQKTQLQNDPTYQSTVAIAASKHEQAVAAQKNADTNRISTLADVIGKESDRQLKVAQILLQHDKQQADQALQGLNATLSVNDQMIDRMREVIGDNDLPLQGENQPGAPTPQGDNPEAPTDEGGAGAA